MKTYNIELTEKQAAILSQACELLARLTRSQIKEIFNHLPIDYNNIDYEGYHDDQLAIETILNKHLKKPPFNSYPDSKSNIAWDLYQVLRKELSWEHAIKQGYVSSKNDERNWKEMSGVHYGEPIKTSEQPLAKITVTNEN
jgi:hypothetical protein